MTRTDLKLWVVYDHPTDFPDSFAARLWLTDRPTGEVLVADTLDDIRAAIAGLMPGAVCLMRQPDDDPVIVETWL